MASHHFATASVAISPDLIGHVKRLYSMAADAKTGNETPHRTELAIPAYILSVAAVEAFVNETFLSSFGRMVLEVSSGDFAVKAEELEKLRLPEKLIEAPSVMLGCSLKTGEQPYQDMVQLIRLRNELIHYKMRERPPRLVQDLAKRGVAFPVPPEQEKGGPHSWADRVSTLEGLRWAHNTACATVRALVDLVPIEKRGVLGVLARSNFAEL